MFNREEIYFLKLISSDFDEVLLNKSSNDRVVDFSYKYNLSYLFYDRLKNRNFLKEAEKERLRKNYIYNLCKELYFKNYGLKIIRLFEKNNIKAIALKSPFLGDRIYGKEGLRYAGCDIDLLIPYSDFDKAYILLSKNGYRLKTNPDGWEISNFYHQYYIEPSFVELHFKFFSYFFIPDIDPNLYFEKTFVKEIDGFKVNFLSNELLFIYLCMLTIKDENRYKRFCYFVDLYYFLRRYENDISYSEIKDIIDRYRLHPYIFLCLEYLSFLDIHIPKELSDSIRLIKFKKIFLRYSLENYYKYNYNPFGFRFKIYGYLIFAFSGCTLKGIINNIFKLYNLSYKNFLMNFNYKNSIYSFILHFLFFIKRIFSRKPRFCK